MVRSGAEGIVPQPSHRRQRLQRAELRTPGTEGLVQAQAVNEGHCQTPPDPHTGPPYPHILPKTLVAWLPASTPTAL